MNKYRVYSKDGSVERCRLTKVEYSGTFMGDRVVTSSFTSATEIAFDVFDYIEFRGEKFELEMIPTVKKVSSYQYEYDLRFVSLKYELERCMFRDFVPNDNEVVYPTPVTVEFTGKVNYLTERIQACLDRMYGAGVWSIVVSEGVDSEEKNLSLSNQNCWNALSLVNTEYKLNFHINGRTVVVGDSEAVQGVVFEYGKGNGLYEIERAADSDTGIVTKLIAYGGTRNLDYSYPKTPEWNDSVLPNTFILSPLRLMLPSFKLDGKTDYLLADDALIAKYGIREGVMMYDDIYPTITGATNSKGERIDKIAGVDAITDEETSEFDVYLNDLGFDLNDSLTTETPQLVMKTGALQGYAFNIKTIGALSNGGVRVTLEKNSIDNSDTGGYYIPNNDFNMSVGDEFVLIGILMPQEYIRNAENRLLARAQEYLNQYSTTNYSYSIGVDEIFMAKNPSVMAEVFEGKKMKINDDEIGINEELVTIQSLTIEDGDGLIPRIKVTLNNNPSASTLERIQGQIANIESTANSQYSAQTELAKQYQRKLNTSYFNRLFVAIDANGNEIAPNDTTTPIASVRVNYGLWTEQFLSAKGMNNGGGSSEGGATTLGGLRNVANAADSTYDVAKMLVLEADSNLWTLKNLSELVGGLDEAELEQYLTSNKYVTEQWLLNKEYATQRDIDARIDALVNGAPAAYDTLKEIADVLQGNVNGINDILTVLGTKVGRDEFTAAVDSIYDELDTKLDIETFAELFEKVRLSDGTYAIKAKLGLFSDVFLSTKGANNSGTSSIGGAVALYQLNDVAKNSSVDGVLGATQGALLMYNGDKWQGVSQRDIVPNLDGYATEDLLYRALNSYQPLITTTNKLPYSLIGDAPDVYTKTEMDSALSGYLPLSGGTISNTTADALTIDRNSTNPTYICFKNNGALLGYMGFNTSKEPVISVNGIKKLIHSGNIGEQSVAYATKAGNSDALGGVDRNSILELNYKGTTKISTAGWYRIGKFKRYANDGNACRLYLYRGYTNANNESYIFDITYTYSHRYCITQTAGHFATSHVIPKIRIDSSSSTSTNGTYAYIDVYYGANSTNTIYWMSEGCLESYTEATLVEALTGTAIEFETTKGCKSALGFTGDLTGNATSATSATKLQTARNIWGQSFDGTGDITGKLKLSNGTAGGLGVLDADGNVVNAVTLSSKSELYFGYDAPSKGVNTYLRGNTIRLTYGADNTVGFVLNTLGRIGIGTTNPNYKVHVVGEILLTPEDTGGLFYRVKNDNYELNFGLGSTGGNRGIYDRTNASWLIYRDATTNVLIPKGNLGVGIINPLYKLDVDGATRTTKLVIGDGTIEWDAEHKGFKVTGGLYSTTFISAKGVNENDENTNTFGRLDNWADYDSTKNDVLSAKLGYELYSTQNSLLGKVSALESKSTNVSFTQAVTSGTQIGTITIDGIDKNIYAPTIPTKLSQFTDDVVSGNYLPLSGGTLTGKITIQKYLQDEWYIGGDSAYGMIVNRTGGWTNTMLRIDHKETATNAQFRAGGNNTGVNYLLFLFDGQDSSTASLRINRNSLTHNGNTIIHSGNIGSQSVASATSATKLQTARSIWGQSFDGTADVSGALTNVTTITASGAIKLTDTTSTGAAIEFSRDGANYIIFPSGGYIGFATARGTSNISCVISKGSVRPTLTDTGSVGHLSYRWANIYAVDGNYSGTVTANKIKIGNGTIEWDEANKGFKVTGGIYTESYLSAKGVSSSNDNPVGGLIKSLWKIGDLGNTFSDDDNDTFNAYTINEIHKRVSLLEGKATNVTYTANQASGTLLGTLTIDGASKTIYAPTIPTSDINKGVTAYNWGNHASVGYAMASALNGYMPLSGGTIDGSLTIVNGHLVAPHLRFSVDGKEKILTPYAAFDNDLSYYDGTSWYRVIHSGNIGSQSVSYATSAGNATALGGKSLSNGNYTFDSVPYIKSDGVMEVGKYIDFHNDNTTGNDYDCRLDIQGAYGNTVHLPTDSGVLALTTSNVASADRLFNTNPYTIWGQTFFEGGKPKSVVGMAAMGVGGMIDIQNTDEINRYGGDLYIQQHGGGTGSGTGGTTTGNVMMCSNGGNVGIGITYTPTYRLEVGGNLNAKALYQDGQTLDNYYATVSLVDKLVAALQGQIDGLWHRNGFNELSAEHIMADSLAVAMLMSNTIRTSGSASIGTTLYAKDGIWSDGYVSAKGQNTSSDMRLKDVLNEVALCVKDIANAPSVRFAWKNGGGVDVGSSAQYWQGLLPDAVKEHDGWLEMQYANIALLSAIALAKNFETMDERVARLERENKELRNKIDMMERRIA